MYRIVLVSITLFLCALSSGCLTIGISPKDGVTLGIWVPWYKFPGHKENKDEDVIARDERINRTYCDRERDEVTRNQGMDRQNESGGIHRIRP